MFAKVFLFFLLHFLFFYSEMEGDDIPYGKFHFETLYDFLYASNEFHLFKLRGGLFIRARPKKHSQHIVNMVSEQKTTTKNMKFSKSQPRKITNLANNQSQKVYSKVLFPSSYLVESLMEKRLENNELNAKINQLIQ